MKGGLREAWSKAFQAQDIRSAMRPLFTLCRLLGLYPLDQHRIAKAHLLYTASLFFGLISHFLLYMDREHCLEEHCFFKQIRNVSYALTYLSLVASVAGILLKRRSADRAILCLDKVDKSLRRFGLGVRYTTRYLPPVLLRLVFTFGILLAYLTIGQTKYMSLMEMILFRTAQVATLTLTYTVARPFVVLVSFMDLHLENLTARLLVLTKSVYYLGRREKMEALVHAYNDICDMSNLMNDSYSCQIFILLPTVFFNITSSMFLLIVHLSHYENALSWNNIIMSFTKMCFWIFLMLGILRTADSCQLKGKVFSTTLFNLMIQDRAKELVFNEKLLLHMNMKREVKLTACGFFCLDNSLIHSILAAATTYLIILIQFGFQKTLKH